MSVQTLRGRRGAPSIRDQAKAPDPLDAVLGMTIRLRRREIGLSQESLAEACGVSFQQIQKYESGANRISFSRLVQMARALGCHVGDLVVEADAGGETFEDVALQGQLNIRGADELLALYARLRPAERSSLVELMNVAKAPWSTR